MLRTGTVTSDRTFPDVRNNGIQRPMDDSDENRQAEVRITARLVDSLYTEAMVLADEARSYFDDAGRDERAMLEPFARGETSRNRVTGGAGLGLTLARAIAEQHGGRLLLANRTGPDGQIAGLVAELRLPLSRR